MYIFTFYFTVVNVINFLYSNKTKQLKPNNEASVAKRLAGMEFALYSTDINEKDSLIGIYNSMCFLKSEKFMQVKSWEAFNSLVFAFDDIHGPTSTGYILNIHVLFIAH